jgi:hypothetical protein
VISGDLSKPPPSASRPPHRASASIRDEDTYTEPLDSEAVKAIHVQTVAFNAKRNHRSALYQPRAARFRHTFLGTLLGTTRRVFRSVCSENGRKTRQGDGFSNRRICLQTTERALLLRMNSAALFSGSSYRAQNLSRRRRISRPGNVQRSEKPLPRSTLTGDGRDGATAPGVP